MHRYRFLISHVYAIYRAGKEPTLDASLPVTKVQVRMKDGSRKVVQLNQDKHTVRDLRAYVQSLSLLSLSLSTYSLFR